VKPLDNKIAAVKMRNITKTFGKTVANDKVWLDIYRGEILALLGENGSGKTTLMNMLAGIYFPDEGQIFIDGKEVVIRSPKDAFDLGIGMIHQHFKLVDVLTAAENIVLGLKEAGRFDLKRVSARIEEICKTYGFEVDPKQKIYDMSVSQKQTVEIVKALYRGADILILDEPTAVLTPQETDKLFAVLRNMRDAGKAIVIITHKMHEVESLSDRVAILRHGQFIGDMVTKSTNAQEMTNMMVGHAVTLNIERPEPVDPKPRIEVKNLTVRSIDGILKLDDVSFTAYSGEILGIAGISGCGQKELLESIAGLQPIEKGSISYIEDDGSRDELIGKDPLAIAEMGVALSFVPEDRLGMGLVGSMDLADNMMLRSFRKGRGIFTDRKSPHKLAENVVEELDVSTPGISTPVRRLSGGNVQKVLVGREIASAPTVLLTAYAVRGLDINSSYTIYDLINKQKKNGVAVIYVGEDLDVLLELADRILVLCSGKVSGIIPGRGAKKRDVGMMMTKLGGNANEQ
jgi:general nucleoside transport system ATP-binding protein